jgi:O-Antigen ligase
MTLDTVLALGLLLTTATKLRLPGLPVGPGEVLLVVWITFTLLRNLSRASLPITPALRRMLIFWTWFTVAESLGTLCALTINYPHDTALFLHDVMAYPLIGTVACLSVLGQDAERHLEQVTRSMVLWGSLLLAPQLAAAWHLVHLPIDPWFGNRFEGWSTNPNQLALLCALLVLGALHLADIATAPKARAAALLGMVVPLFIGRLTKTDTFTFALLAAMPVFLARKIPIWLAWSGARASLRPAVATILLLAVPVGLLAGVPFAVRATTDTTSLFKGMMKKGGKEAKQEADLRLALWHEAIDRGLKARMLGLGPGPHLPIPPDLVAARETEPTLDKGAGHPPVNGTPDFEAHNTLLDLFTQGGVIADASILWLVGHAFFRAWTARAAGLAALLCGLMLFAMTNLIVREPIFWFGIALSLVAGTEASRAVTRQNWS